MAGAPVNLDALTSAGKAIGKSYGDMATEKLNKAKSIVNKITALGDIDFSSGEDAGSTESFGDVIADAGQVLSDATDILAVLANNPLVSTMLQNLQSQYGWDLGSPLAFVQSFVGKNGSTLMKVIGAMFQFPIYANKFTVSAQALIYAIDSVWAELESSGIPLPDGPIGAYTTVDPAIMLHLTNARMLLSQSLGSNPDQVRYSKGKSELVEAISELGQVRTWISSLGADIQNALALTVLDNLRNTYSGAKNLKGDKDKVVELYNTIKNTVVTMATPDPSMAKLRKALSELSKTITLMQKPGVVHSVMTAQYLLALGAIKATLDMAKPQYNSPLLPGFNNNAVTMDLNLLYQVYADIGRISNILNYPREIHSLRAVIDRAKADLNAWIVERDAFYLQVEALWGNLPGMRDVIETFSKMFAKMGMDRAADCLASGDISSLLGMSPLTATSSGAALVAIDTVLSTCRMFGITYFDDQMTALKKKLQPTAKKDAAAVKSKRNTKLAQTKKAIEDALGAIDEAASLATDVAGLVIVITEMTAP